LGIASVTTQFSVINAFLWKGLPFPESDRLVSIEQEAGPRDAFSPNPSIPEYLDWRRHPEAFEDLGAYYSGTVNLTSGTEARRYAGCFITGSGFQLLRVEASLGRGLGVEDDLPGSPEVIVLSHRVWRDDFGTDPDIVGQPVIVNGRQARIAGVMPEGFAFPMQEDIYLPLFKQQAPSMRTGEDARVAIHVFGRLRNSVTMEQAMTSMNAPSHQIGETQTDLRTDSTTIKIQSLFDDFMGNQTFVLTVSMMLITVLILVIASANVANLLMARSVLRRKEVAIRSTLGATRSRILAQFLTESLLLAVIASSLGIVLALHNTSELNQARIQVDLPVWIDFSLDARVYAGAVLITLATGFLSGLIPAFRASRQNESEILKDTDQTSTSLYLGRFSRFVVILQISVAAVVLTLVVLFVKSMSNALTLTYAYNPDEVLSARMGLFNDVYPEESDRVRFVDDLLRQLQSHPKISHCAVTSRYQFTGGQGVRYSVPDARDTSPGSTPIARFQRVSSGFFDTLQLPLLEGRPFDPSEFGREVPGEAIVNKAFAERAWGAASPLGKHFRAGILPVDNAVEAFPLLEVVAVVGNMQEINVFSGEDDGAAFIIPQTASPFPSFITLLVRGPGDPQNLLPIVEKEIALLDRNLPLYDVGTPRGLNQGFTAQFEFFASIFISFGTIATLLAGLGVHGVIAFSVNHRITEFGIRQALGATPRRIFGLVYLHALKQLGTGFFFALLILSPVFFLSPLREVMAIFFYEMDPHSPLPFFIA
ncbi:MAG TPA: ABC transporter permease, partial [Oceanipulchritudo sp.]|nr:ABC transporter permease [Oceanipulchritudo sp.]